MTAASSQADPSSPSPHLRVEIGRATRITLTRPDRQNAMTAEMGAALAAAVEAINAAEGVRVVVLQGEGRAFSAGGDFGLIEANTHRNAEQNRAGMLAFYRSFLSVLHLKVPTVAVLHGAAVGAGLCLALACDLRLAATEARLGVNFVRIGLHPGMGATVLLPRVVGHARAAELLLSGRLIDGVEAERIGLVHRAVPRAELSALVDERVAELLASAPIAVAQTKSTLLAPLLAELELGLPREAGAQAVDFMTQDLRSAIDAFRAGRTPVFEGR